MLSTVLNAYDVDSIEKQQVSVIGPNVGTPACNLQSLPCSVFLQGSGRVWRNAHCVEMKLKVEPLIGGASSSVLLLLLLTH